MNIDIRKNIINNFNDAKKDEIKASIIYEKELDYPLEVGIIMEVEDNKVYILEIL